MGLSPDQMLHCTDCKNKSKFVVEYFTMLSATGLCRFAHTPGEAARLGTIVVTNKIAFED